MTMYVFIQLARSTCGRHHLADQYIHVPVRLQEVARYHIARCSAPLVASWISAQKATSRGGRVSRRLTVLSGDHQDPHQSPEGVA